MGSQGDADVCLQCSQSNTSLRRKTTDMGLVHRVVCPFTLQLSLVLINRPQRDGTLSWHWYTVAAGNIRTRDLAITSPTLHHMATSALFEIQCYLYYVI